MSNISKIDLQGLGNLRSLYISNKLNKHFTLEILNIKKRVNKRFTLTLKRTVIISNLLTLTISILHTPTPKPSFLSPTVIVCGNFLTGQNLRRRKDQLKRSTLYRVQTTVGHEPGRTKIQPDTWCGLADAEDANQSCYS